MSRSQLLIDALKAAELVLTAETSDTAELAKIAEKASGIPADRILLGIDLTGIDLRSCDVSHLLDKQAKYHGATMSVAQRRQFERSERPAIKRRKLLESRSSQVNAIINFIDKYEEDSFYIDSNPAHRPLTGNDLRAILLSPLLNIRYNEIIREKYTVDVLSGLLPWAHDANTGFFLQLFELFGFLNVPAGSAVVDIIDRYYLPEFGQVLGDMIAKVLPNADLDKYWLTLNLRHSTLEDNIRISKSRKVFKSTPFLRALQISEVRPVHQAAVEGVLDVLKDTTIALQFLEKVRYDCNSDEAERIAARITNSEWPPTETQSILNVNTHPRVRGALFRQLLQQGNEARVIEVLRWLNAGRGAVGALSLDDGFRNIKSFGVGLRFAEEAAPSFADNQMAVVYFALRNLANSDNERKRLEDFCKRVRYKPRIDSSLRTKHANERIIETERLAKLLNSDDFNDVS